MTKSERESLRRQPEDRTCRVCGCWALDCRQCIERTGAPCHWVEQDLCSACARFGYSAMIRVKLGSDNVACVRVGRRTFRASATESSRRAALRLTEKVAIAVRAESARYEQYRALSMMAGSAVLRLTFKA